MKRLQLKAENVADQGTFTDHASVFDAADLDNNVVEPGAFAKSIAAGTAAAGVLIFGQHDDRKKPLGKLLELREDAVGPFVKGQISDTATGRDYRQLIKDGVPDQMSIGYVAQKYDVNTNNVRHLRRVGLLEISIVDYPVNTEAEIESCKGGHMQMKIAEEQTPTTREAKEEAGAEGQTVTATEEQPAQLLEQAAGSGMTKALKATADVASDETKDDPADDETKDDDDKDDEAKAVTSAAEKAETAPTRSAMQRKYVGIYMDTDHTDKEKKPGLPVGIDWMRPQKCTMCANKDYNIAASIARKGHGGGSLECQIKVVSVTAPTDNDYPIPEVYANEIVPLLRDKAIILRLGATELPVDRDNISIPKMTSGVSASYAGESRKIKAPRAEPNNVRMSSKELICKVPISNDLIHSNACGADQLILNDATTVMVLAMDHAAFLGKGTEFEPTGLFNMANIPTIGLDAVPDEIMIGKMLATLLQDNTDTSELDQAFSGFAWETFYNAVQAASGLYLCYEQMNGGKLSGRKFAVSNQLPNGSGSNHPTNVVLDNFSKFMIGRQGSVEPEMFREDTVTDEDSNIISAVDQDCTILHIIGLHDFGIHHKESFMIDKSVQMQK